MLETLADLSRDWHQAILTLPGGIDAAILFLQVLPKAEFGTTDTAVSRRCHDRVSTYEGIIATASRTR
ncbi:hypothetical protein [Halovivax ruber]|uniref:hypothetical protein n=1 Tax=Halovivax ruber TaxID=387341 RepID=UPI001494C8EA|nr:hypothetical protein [Halovivax ruber]